MKNILMLGVTLLALALAARALYQPNIQIKPDWMDSTVTRDEVYDTPTLLVSNRQLSQADHERPVIIAAHGFTATSYEWREFQDYVENNSNTLVSTVSLGGHGTSYHDFKKSTYTEWGEPILAEYNKLREQGFTNISLIGASTGGTLLIDHLQNNDYNPAPTHIFLIDAIVKPVNKMLYLSPFVAGWLYKDRVAGVSADPDADEACEAKYWYQVRSYHALSELTKLIKRTEKHLKQGIEVPEGTAVTIYQSDNDPIVDPVSADLFHEGLIGSQVELNYLSSSKHVFTRLTCYKQVHPEAQALQKKIFDEIIRQISLYKGRAY